MRSRLLLSAFLLFVVASAGALRARALPGACAMGCCADGAACCVEDGTCGKGCCMKQAGGCCLSHAKQQAAAPVSRRDQQWTVVNFINPVRVAKSFVSGTVLIVHDDQKMQRGEPCTTFYRFDPAGGPKEALVSFHCKPRRTAAAEAIRLTTVLTEPGVPQLVEYQIAGDSEAHGIPR